jgi:hypothetical protein
MMFLLYTGARKREVLDAKWQEHFKTHQNLAIKPLFQSLPKINPICLEIMLFCN